MRVAFALWLALALTACGSTSRKRVVAGGDDPLQDVGAGLDELRRDLESTVLENYSHLGLGNLHAFADSVSDHEPIALLGPRASDMVVHDSRDREMRDRRLYRARDVRLHSKNLQMHLSDDGSAAWVADEISYRVPHRGKVAALALRYTAVLVRRSGRWEIMAEHLSYPLEMERVTALAKSKELPRLRPLGEYVPANAKVVSKVVARLNQHGLARRRDILSAALSSLVWLPPRSSEFRGRAIASAPSVVEMFGEQAKAERTGVVAYVTDSRTIAWVAEHTYVRATAPDAELLVPTRALYVLERTESEWKVVQMHVSVPLTTELINELVFGERELDGNDSTSEWRKSEPPHAEP